jgi:hypothetical protein
MGLVNAKQQKKKPSLAARATSFVKAISSMQKQQAAAQKASTKGAGDFLDPLSKLDEDETTVG